MQKKYLRLLTISVVLIALPFAVRFENTLIMPLATMINATLFFIYRDESERQLAKRSRLHMFVLILGFLIIVLLNFKYLVASYILGIICGLLFIFSFFVDKKAKSLRLKDKLLIGGSAIFLLAIILAPFVSISIIIWLFIIALVIMVIGEKRC